MAWHVCTCAVGVLHGVYAKLVQNIVGTETARAASFLHAPGFGWHPVLLSSIYMRSTLHVQW